MTNRIETEGEHILSVCIAAMTAAGVDLPKRQYFSPCPPIAECDQLVVWLSRIFFGSPGAEQAASAHLQGPRSCEFGVVVYQCLPTPTAQGRPPSGSAWGKAAMLLTDQTAALYLGLMADVVARGCREYAVGVLTTLADEGGLGGFATVYQSAL